MKRFAVVLAMSLLFAACASSSPPASTVAPGQTVLPADWTPGGEATDKQLSEIVAAIDELAALVAGGADGDATETWANETSLALMLDDAILTDSRLGDFRAAMLAMIDAVAAGTDQAPSVAALLGMRDDLAALIGEAPATTDAPKVSLPKSYATLSERSWRKLVKNPDAYAGKGYKVVACVWQFDAATGDDSFLANASWKKQRYWNLESDNASFTGEPRALVDIVEGDIVSINAVVVGAYSYDTQAGGNTTVPSFFVAKIKREKGSCD